MLYLRDYYDFGWLTASKSRINYLLINRLTLSEFLTNQININDMPCRIVSTGH